MRDAKAAGYKIDLYYVALDSVERNIERVKFRVALGGHDIPEEAIRRRHKGSLENLSKALALADEAVIVDNSDVAPRVIFQIDGGSVVNANGVRGNPLHDLLTKKVQEAEKIRS